jgi:hypothetical protein
LKENANFAKGMATLKEGMKEKINWNRVDLVMVGYFLFVILTKSEFTYANETF